MITITPANLFTLLKSHLPDDPTILEAGAFTGNDTKKLSSFFPNGTVHAFEPVPEIFDVLTLQTKNLTNVRRYQIALSSTTGLMPFYLAEHPKKPGKICQAGTILKPKERLTKSPIQYPKLIHVPAITIGDWLKKHAVKKVDFLWLDLQGHELSVLQACPEILNKVQLVYLEVNFIQAYENQPSYQEINNCMEKYGFRAIARDFDENPQWFFGNVLYLSGYNTN